MNNVAILIPTYLRPAGLMRTLDAIKLLAADNINLSVVIADNDPVDQQGFKLTERIKDKFPWPLIGLVVSERGIPHVRNALVKYAIDELKADFSLFIDDDEAPSPDWLLNILAVQQSTKADIVGGKVTAEFETTPPAWAVKLGLYETSCQESGFTDLVDSTANVLISNDIFSRIDYPWFNPDFALTGGSDKELFLRLKARGAIFAWAEESVVCETIPSSRMTKEWIYKRSYRTGNLDMRLTLAEQNTKTFALELAKSITAFIVALATLVVFCPFENKRVMANRRLNRQLGKLAILRGHLYQEYAVIHGH